MLTPRRERDRWTRIVLTVVGSLAAFILGLEIFGPSNGSTREVLKTITLVFTVTFVGFHWLYSSILWRILNPGLDINGRWSYRNDYETPVEDNNDTPMTSNSGWFEIKQTLEKINYNGRRTERNGVACDSEIDFHALAFDVSDNGVGVLLYEVHREQTIRAMEAIRIITEKSGDAPVRIRGNFNSIEPLPTCSGSATYEYLGPASVIDRIVEGLRKKMGRPRLR